MVYPVLCLAAPWPPVAVNGISKGWKVWRGAFVMFSPCPGVLLHSNAAELNHFMDAIARLRVCRCMLFALCQDSYSMVGTPAAWDPGASADKLPSPRLEVRF